MSIPHIGSFEMRMIVSQLIALILSIAVHEFGHAFVADRLGDGLPRSQGRVTLNPVAHMDPLGTLVFPIVGLVFSGGSSFGFGWGRPVQVSERAFTRRLRMKTSMTLVAIAGPAMNLLMGLVLTLLFVIALKVEMLDGGSMLAKVILRAIQLNFGLLFFNLIPTPPLDGGHILRGLLPDRYDATFDRLAPYGIFVLFLFIMTPLSILITAPAGFLFSTWLSACAAVIL